MSQTYVKKISRQWAHLYKPAHFHHLALDKKRERENEKERMRENEREKERGRDRKEMSRNVNSHKKYV